jgi:organic hydroperoxide reductase OsmC/OhrA
MRGARRPLFRVAAQWLGGRALRLRARGRPPIRVAGFEDGNPEMWSAEELLGGALAACYELMLAAVAKREDVPLHTVQVRATVDVERPPQRGGLTLTSLELEVELSTDRGRELDAEEVAIVAKREFFERTLDIPVHLRRIDARVAAAAA